MTKYIIDPRGNVKLDDGTRLIPGPGAGPIQTCIDHAAEINDFQIQFYFDDVLPFPREIRRMPGNGGITIMGCDRYYGPAPFELRSEDKWLGPGLGLSTDPVVSRLAGAALADLGNDV